MTHHAAPSSHAKAAHQLLGDELPLGYDLVNQKLFGSVTLLKTGITHLLSYFEHTLPFPGENKSLHLSRWENSQRASHHENSWLSLVSSPSLQVVYARVGIRGGGRNWKRLWKQMGPTHQAVLNISPMCRMASSSCPCSKVLMVHELCTLCLKGSRGRTGSFATVIWVTSQQHLGVNKITCSAAT